MNKKLLTLAVIISALTLSGCANTSVQKPSVTQSGFDGGRVVDVDAHGNACSSMVCTGLGAQWSSAQPDIAFLKVIIFNEIKGITGAKINIDGKFYDTKPAAQANQFEHHGPMATSEMTFIVPIDVIRKITTSKRTWLRVSTTDGYLEDPVIDGQKDSKAYYVLKKFIAEVDKK